MSTSFDISAFDRIPNTTTAGALALVRALVTSASVDDLPAGKKALRRARERAEHLRTLFVAAAPPKTESTVRAADTSVDRAWRAFEHFLASFEDLDPSFSPHVAKANDLHAKLFPNGLSFLRLPYDQQWAEGEAVLARITQGGLEATLDEIGARPFLAQARARQKAYGAALEITRAKSRSSAEPPALLEPLRDLQSAVATYARVVASAAQNEELALERAARSLAPIVALRSRQRDRKKSAAGVGAGEAVPDEPADLAASNDPIPTV